MTDRPDLDAAVVRGIEFLDEKVPRWFDRIDLSKLDLQNPYRCILGQIGDPKEYWEVGEELFHGNEDWEEIAVSYGFDIDGPKLDFARTPMDREYQALTEVWRERLAQYAAAIGS